MNHQKDEIHWTNVNQGSFENQKIHMNHAQFENQEESMNQF